jgi:hypothetical protein
MTLSVIYYSNNRVAARLQRFCLDALGRAVGKADAELVCVTWEPVPTAARQIIWPRHVADHCNVYGQILAGIEAARTRMVALAEHDVLYPPGYFEALAEAGAAGVCYNTNVWRLNQHGFFRGGAAHLLSNCGGRRGAVARGIRGKLAEARRGGIPEWAEPAADAEFAAPCPVVDVRHGRNFTGERRARNGRYRGELEYWGECGRYTGLW